MSVCSPCTQCQSVPIDFTTLTIGTVSATSTAHYVYLRHVASDIETRYAITSDSSGLLILNRDGDGVVITEGMYEASASLASAYNQNTTVNITVDGSAYECLKFEVVAVLGTDGEQSEFNEIHLTI